MPKFIDLIWTLIVAGRLSARSDKTDLLNSLVEPNPVSLNPWSPVLILESDTCTEMSSGISASTDATSHAARIIGASYIHV
jgi:hypothetical protein